MKRRVLYIMVLAAFCLTAHAQIDAGSVLGIPSATTAQIFAVTTASEGSMAYSTDDNTIYFFNGTTWVNGTADQNATEVALSPNIDVDGDTTNETNVQEAINDLAAIAGNNIYSIDGSLTGNRTVDNNGNQLNFDNANSGINITGSTTGDGTSNGALVHIDQNTGWGGNNSPWALYVDGYSYFGGLRIFGGGSRSIFKETGQIDMAVGDNSPITFSQNSSEPRLEIQSAGTIKMNEYGNNTITGTGTSLLAVEADGDVVEVNSLTASRIFYPPSIAIDASTNGNFSVNLYTEYTNQFQSVSIVKNPSAPTNIPVYAANELDYYVTYYDPAVFRNLSIDDNGLLSYEVFGQPADYNSLINVVFVVK